jgi:hypothetical protein
MSHRLSAPLVASVRSVLMGLLAVTMTVMAYARIDGANWG